MSQYRTSLQEAARFIRENDRFLVISHVNPDGDTTGSALALVLMLEQAGKQYVVINEGETPERFGYLPRFDKIINLSEQTLNETFDRVVAVDVADSLRMGDVRHLFTPDVQIVNIDHHPTNDRFGTINVIRTDAAATAEIMYELMEIGQFPCNEEIAMCIYTGLLTDTGGFRYSNTSPNVLQIASKLLAYGIKPGEIAERSLEAITLEHVQLLRRALQTLTITHNNLVASLRITHQDLSETNATNEDMSGIVNYGRNIDGMEIGLLFAETEPNVVKVSLRSRSRVDVGQVAKTIGGGGHARAAGCTVRASLAEAEEQVWTLLSQALGVTK